jgi:hypothetical protein
MEDKVRGNQRHQSATIHSDDPIIEETFDKSKKDFEVKPASVDLLGAVSQLGDKLRTSKAEFDDLDNRHQGLRRAQFFARLGKTEPLQNLASTAETPKDRMILARRLADLGDVSAAGEIYFDVLLDGNQSIKNRSEAFVAMYERHCPQLGRAWNVIRHETGIFDHAFEVEFFANDLLYAGMPADEVFGFKEEAYYVLATDLRLDLTDRVEACEALADMQAADAGAAKVLVSVEVSNLIRESSHDSYEQLLAAELFTRLHLDQIS